MQPSEFIEENNEENSSNDQMVRTEKLLIQLCDTGIGINPEYVKYAWKSFSEGDISMTKKQDGAGLGLSICKNLVDMNGGEIKVESQLKKGSNFHLHGMLNYYQWHLYQWRPNLINKQIIFEKVDTFDTFEKGIKAVKIYKELYDQFTYDVVFIGLYENNKEETINFILELKELLSDINNLAIIFIVFPSHERIKLAGELMEIFLETFVVYTPITLNKLIKQFMYLEIIDA
ncbi:hybrid sensor histidine kinase/response regulator [Gigaspora margarita]|uniref:histidine kinase n=1 Tax=Gigaspora margarita TaxID=4874 RepID=A0A8H4B2Z0_GIGMA|nr:hybrid sensor histidine kinase/response regulator [Gigaspora margarita]